MDPRPGAAALLFQSGGFGCFQGMDAKTGVPPARRLEFVEGQHASPVVTGGCPCPLPGFPAPPGDLRFIGKPVDFVAFVGASRGEVREVLFVEVKSGASAPNRAERSLRDAVKAGRVRWEEYGVPDLGGRPAGGAPDEAS
jgi:hypothetical protein